MRWDLVDRFEILKKGCLARAKKNLTGREDFLAEQSTSKPCVPEALFIEMIAQAGGVLYGLGLEFKKEVILAKIEEARFPREVSPPCELSIEARVDEEREDGAWISGEVYAAGHRVAEAKIMLIAMDSLGSAAAGKVVFNDSFINHHEIWKVAKQSEELKV